MVYGPRITGYNLNVFKKTIKCTGKGNTGFSTAKRKENRADKQAVWCGVLFYSLRYAV